MHELLIKSCDITNFLRHAPLLSIQSSHLCKYIFAKSHKLNSIKNHNFKLIYLGIQFMALLNEYIYE